MIRLSGLERFTKESLKSDKIFKDNLVTLPERDQQILRLRFIGFSLRAIEWWFNLPPKYARRIINRAIARLWELS